MGTLIENPITINRIITTHTVEARAIEDPLRAHILQILYKRKLTLDMIAAELKKKGYVKASTTVRHHLEVLKQAGLVEVVKINEVRGAILKFYGTPTKFLNFEIPTSFDSDYSRIIDTTSTRIQKMMKSISEKCVTKVKKKNKPKDIDQFYIEFILMEIMNRALTNVFENNHISKK